jgi:hypothetical protein
LIRSRRARLPRGEGPPAHQAPAQAGPSDSDYRVIYEIMDEQLVILVVGVGHRREIYRAMS